MATSDAVSTMRDTDRVLDLRGRVRKAMKRTPISWTCPPRINTGYMGEPLPVRKARGLDLKLSEMPTDLWEGQLIAGSMTLEMPRLHSERGFPDYTTAAEKDAARKLGLGVRSVFGHIVPDYPKLLRDGLMGILVEVSAQRTEAQTPDENAFLDSVVVALRGVMGFAERLADRCESEAGVCANTERVRELIQMAANLRQAPAGPPKSLWQALQSVWLLHMVFHASMNGNALGRADQYLYPFLVADLEKGVMDENRAFELVSCFCLKFNERAQTNEEQRPEARSSEEADFSKRTRHSTSSQLGTRRDSLDATNHWLQNIIVGGLRPDGSDGTNTLSHMLLEAYRRNEMTNPLMTVRVHSGTPDRLIDHACEVLKDGGGMPALFNDEALIPALERMGFPTADARDYTNDGCWEVIIPGRTDFRFQRLSVMLCLEWALNRGVSRRTGTLDGQDTGEPRRMDSFKAVWSAFERQVDSMVEGVVERVMRTVDDRHSIAPVPLLSALTEGAIDKRADLTAGGSKFRTFGMLAESAAYAIDSLSAIKECVFDRRAMTMSELCDALDANFEGHEHIRRLLATAARFGNDDAHADEMGKRVIDAFTRAVDRHASPHGMQMQFPCGVATFSWYIGIGDGLGASPDGRLEGTPVASNFSPALGRDMDGVCAAILSYSKMNHDRLAAGGPLDLRLSKRLVRGEAGTERMRGLIRSLVDLGGSMMTLTVADVEELRAAQRDPDQHASLRVRMGGWCAYFTMLSQEQQEHHIRRQEGRG